MTDAEPLAALPPLRARMSAGARDDTSGDWVGVDRITRSVTGLVLAGGQGRRMGGADKGLQALAGRPLALHALERLSGQTTALAISANRHLDAYAAFGVPVWPDDEALPPFSGPLAGVWSGLRRSHTHWLACVPCDVPGFPLDLVPRLAAGAAGERTDVAVAATPAARGPGLQPAFCLLNTRAGLADDLRRHLDAGERSLRSWLSRHRAAEVVFDEEQAFANLNTPADLRSSQHAFARSNPTPQPATSTHGSSPAPAIPPPIRPLATADLPAYKALRDACLAAHEEAFTSDAATEAGRSADSYADRAAADGAGFTLVAWLDGRLAGALTCSVDPRPKGRHIGHLQAMMVADALRGRGIGRALLDAAIERARAPHAGLVQLTLSVTAGNAPALRLYGRAGFVRYGTLPRAVCLDGRYLDKDLMVLALR